MSTITGFGIPPSFYRSSPLTSATSAANQAVEQTLDASGSTNAGGGATTQTGATASIPTGFSAAPKLSADVIGALIESQAQQTAGGTSGSAAAGQAANLSGATAITGQTVTSPNSSSGPLTLQQIAKQFDLHNITYQQEQQLQGELVSSGALTQQDGSHFEALNTVADVFDSQHFELRNGQLVSTTPSPSGRIDLATQDFPPDDEIQRFQRQFAEDPSLGDSTQTAADQKILNVLNELDSIRNGGTA
jgi:hypothetical protein